MEKKKICFIAQFPPPIHGLSKAVDTLYNSKAIKKYKLDKVDITNNKQIFKNLFAIRQSDAELFYFTISQTRWGNLRDLMILLAIGNRPCVIHLHGGYYRTLLEHLPKWQKKANYKAISKLDGAIVLGPSLRWIFEGMLSDNKIFTVANCVDDAFLMSDEEFVEKVNSASNRKIKHVLFLSNFISSKGYPDVLEMANIEKNRGGERLFHFDFAGKFFDQKEEDFFWNYVKEHELDDYITYHGTVWGEKKKNLLKSCDIFCLLTHYPKEGQPISILEAMGNGMSIVTTNHAGIPDIVQNIKNGIVVDTDTSASIVYEKMSQMDYSYIQKNNRSAVMNYYRQSDYESAMLDVFDKIIEDKIENE